MARKKSEIKTFVAKSKAEIDKLVNDFGKDNDVFATHTHKHILNDGTKEYTYVVFYNVE